MDIFVPANHDHFSADCEQWGVIAFSSSLRKSRSSYPCKLGKAAVGPRPCCSWRVRRATRHPWLRPDRQWLHHSWCLDVNCARSALVLCWRLVFWCGSGFGFFVVAGHCLSLRESRRTGSLRRPRRFWVRPSRASAVGPGPRTDRRRRHSRAANTPIRIASSVLARTAPSPPRSRLRRAAPYHRGCIRLAIATSAPVISGVLVLHPYGAQNRVVS